MTPKDQEKLFKAVRERCPDWDNKQASGYVHGVVDGLRRKEPRRVYVRGFVKNKRYALGYIAGFVDAFGADAYLTDWGRELGLSPQNFSYRWWERRNDK